jgi:hypothetical protein
MKDSTFIFFDKDITVFAESHTFQTFSSSPIKRVNFEINDKYLQKKMEGNCNKQL